MMLMSTPQGETTAEPRQTSDRTISMNSLQEVARAGQLRVRAFGETSIFGAAKPYGGNLDRAAADLPEMLSSGMARLYEDEHGLFIGPSNPRFVANDLPAGVGE